MTGCGPTNLPRQSQLGIDVTVAAFAIGLRRHRLPGVRINPGVRITRREHMDPLRSGRSGTSAPGIRRLQRALVIAEVALSIVPLIGGGLMLRSFWNLTHAPIGFDPSGLVTARIQMSFRAFPISTAGCGWFTSAVDQVSQLPGVEAVDGGGAAADAAAQQSFVRKRESVPDSGVRRQPAARVPGIPGDDAHAIVQGRDMSEDDCAPNRMVAVIDQRLAQRLYPEGALGRNLQFKIGGRAGAGGDHRHHRSPVRAARVSDGDLPHVFLSYNIMQVEPWLVVRTSRDGGEDRSGDPPRRRSPGHQPSSRRHPPDAGLRRHVGRRHSLHDVDAYRVRRGVVAAGGHRHVWHARVPDLQRTQEFGVRMALGATAAR